MAHIHSETLVITFSKLLKTVGDVPEGEDIISDETISALEQVAQELVPTGVIVEVNKV